MIFRLKQDDPLFGLPEGDELLCINYQYDAEARVLRRISDGYDPQCNQYTTNVGFVRWGTAADTEQPGAKLA